MEETENGKRKMIRDLLSSWYRDDAPKIDVFIIEESQENPSWIKLTFPNIWEKFQFESKLKKHWEEQTALGNKTFFSSRLVWGRWTLTRQQTTSDSMTCSMPSPAQIGM